MVVNFNKLKYSKLIIVRRKYGYNIVKIMEQPDRGVDGSTLHVLPATCIYAQG